MTDEMKKMGRTSIRESEEEYGFEIVYEERYIDEHKDEQDESGWALRGLASFWIDAEGSADRIYIMGVDSAGYDITRLPLSAAQARAVGELLIELSKKLESGEWKEDEEHEAATGN